VRVRMRAMRSRLAPCNRPQPAQPAIERLLCFDGAWLHISSPSDRKADVTDEHPTLRPAGHPEDARQALEAALFEVKRVIVGQDGMLERVFVALLSGGHLLLEGVPGLAKTLTIKTVAEVLGGTFKRIQFTPDLVPADLVGTRIYRPDTGGFDTELGPVFCNFLLADEINRAPAKVQSALLEVMQEQQVTIGRETHRVPRPFLVMATQNPIESEGTYPLPEAQVDRFMFKVVIDYPAESDELTVVDRSLRPEADVDRVLTPEELHAYQEAARRVYVDPEVGRYAVALTLATRDPARVGLQGLANYIEFGASPRASINLVHGARALALLRGRNYALPIDVQALAHDVLRHRIVPTYDALAEEITTDAILDQVVQVVPRPKSVVREAVA
jgi:MoxR-like ATPase